MKLNDTVAVITGSAANIGKATALLFAKEGAKVVVTTKNNIEGGNQVVEAIEALGSEAMFVQADLAKPEDVENLFAKTIERFGTIDILVNNAGATNGKPFLEATLEDWQSQSIMTMSLAWCYVRRRRLE